MSRHVLVLNRWTNRYAEFHRYLDHREDRVSYLTTVGGAGPLDADLAEEIRVLPDLTDVEPLVAEAEKLESRHGRFTHVIALSEFDLAAGAELRSRLGIAGRTPAQVRLVRDKIVMKRAVAAAGLRVPSCHTVDTADDVRRVGRELSYPFVLKPRWGADSQDVHVVRSDADLDLCLRPTPNFADFEAESFVEGELYQVDGVVSGGELRTIRSWHCLASCLDFAHGTPFGSVANDDPVLEARITTFTRTVLDALELVDEVFHLELFVEQGTAELVFLEIGARAGGGQVRYVWDEVYGLDLIEASVHLQVGHERNYPTAPIGGAVAGYLMMPQPPKRPAIVHGVSSLLGRVEGLYAESLPAPDTVLDGNGGAVHTAGVYRFQASSSAEVERSIKKAVGTYEMSWTALQERQ